MFRAPATGFLRVPFVQRCEIEVDGERRPGLTCNLSLLGLYVHLAEPPEAASIPASAPPGRATPYSTPASRSIPPRPAAASSSARSIASISPPRSSSGPADLAAPETTLAPA